MTRVKFELPADDLGRATAFYRDVFGWSARQLPFDYVLVDTEGNLVDVARKLEEAGGVLLNAKERVGDFGFSQYVKDSEGSVLCLWESIQD